MRSILGAEKIRAIDALLSEVSGIPGAIAECGVYQGGILERVARKFPKRRVYGFDTFAGLPAEAWTEGEIHAVGDFADTSFQRLRSQLRCFRNVELVRGFFPETGRRIPGDTRFAFVHLDFDYYESTRAALVWLLPRMSDGGIIVLDDWDWEHCPGVRKAVEVLDLQVEETGAKYQRVLRVRHEATPGTAVLLESMLGLGDSLHQRALVRSLLKDGRQVFVSTTWPAVYHDLPVTLVRAPTRLRTQAKNAEAGGFARSAPPAGCEVRHVQYGPETVRDCGGVLAAMSKESGIPCGNDFILPVPDSWMTDRIRALLKSKRPIMVVRPLTVRAEWSNEARNPDPQAYSALYDAIRGDYLTVSIADLEEGAEWLVPPNLPADVVFHRGELRFEELAVLFKHAALVFTAPGFSLLLAQAVSTPHVGVFGAYERAYSFSAGAGNAPSLYIEPIEPSDDFSHQCDPAKKAVDLETAKNQLHAFVEQL